MNERTPRLAELARQVSESTNRLVALAGPAGRPELGDLLVAAAQRWPDRDTTILVIGEQGSGKSSLINALAGRVAPPLLPLGRGVSVVRSGPTGELRLHRPGEEPRILPLDTPAADLDLDPTETPEVVVPAPPVGDNVVLIDTPPLGAVGTGGRAVVDALLLTCDAVILTTGADAPVTAAELDVLVAARRRAGAALLVVTHTDRFQGWRTICTESEASAQRRDPTLLAAAPLPFAAPLVADAATEPDPDEAALLRAESGLDAIVAAIGSQLRDRFRQVRLTGLVHAAADVADQLLEGLGGIADPADLRAQLQAERTRLRERSRTVPVDFTDGCSILRDSIAVDVGREVQSLLESVEDDLQEHRDVGALVDATWQHLDALRIRTDARILTELDELGVRALAALVADADAEPTERAEGASGVRPAWIAKASAVSASLRLRLLQATVSTTGGAALLYTLTMPDTSSMVLRTVPMGISMLIGGVSAAEAFREARQQRTLNEARTRVRSVVEQWRSEYLAAAREQLLRLQRERERALRETIDAAVRDLDARIKALDAPALATATDDPAVLAGQLAAVRDQLRTLAGQLAST